jgi:flagellar basal-body rod protein FlgF
MLYIAMTGAIQAMNLQNVQSNNLANVDTTGFKADLAQARALQVFGPGFDSRAYSMTERPATNMEQGTPDYTGRELDVAIKGEGLFVVMDENGQEAYTRNGNFFVDQAGFLTTGDGRVLVGNAGPMVLPDYEKIEIGVDGTVSVRGLGQGPEALVEVDRLKLVKFEPGEIEKGRDGLFRPREGEAVQPPDFTVQLMTGTLEKSNVSAVGSMLSILSASRQFELQVKLMSKAEEMDAAASQGLKIS